MVSSWTTSVHRRHCMVNWCWRRSGRRSLRGLCSFRDLCSGLQRLCGIRRRCFLRFLFAPEWSSARICCLKTLIKRFGELLGYCSRSWNYKLGMCSINLQKCVCRLSVGKEAEFEYALRGKDWKVYWLLLKVGHPLSIREVQRALHFSSPSVAQHHLEQLRQIGLVQREEIGGQYSLVSEVKIGVLRHFVKLGKLLFPRYFFYAVFSTTFYFVYLLVLMQGFTRENLFVILFGACVSVVFWYEAIRVWLLRPY